MTARSAFYTAYGLLLVAAVLIAVREPLMFQKLNTIRPTERIPDLPIPPDGALDIEATIGVIPFGKKPAWNVHPEIRHRQTILEGSGNCSQMVFGLAVDLNRMGVDYQIIHMFTVDGIGTGDGHTVLRLPVELRSEKRMVVVDVAYRGILTGAQGPLDALDLEKFPIEGWGSIQLNEHARFPDYYESWMSEGILVGYMPSSEVRAYYAFLDRVYFSFASDKQEKYVFDGLALLFGFLPEFWVPRYDEVMSRRGGRAIAHRGALWTLRSALVLVPLCLGLEIVRGRRRD